MCGDRRLAGAALLAGNCDDPHLRKSAHRRAGPLPRVGGGVISCDVSAAGSRAVLLRVLAGASGVVQRRRRRLAGIRRRSASFKASAAGSPAAALSALGSGRRSRMRRTAVRQARRRVVFSGVLVAGAGRAALGPLCRGLAGRAAVGARQRKRDIRQVTLGVEDHHLAVGAGREGVTLGQQLGRGRAGLAVGCHAVPAAQNEAVIRSIGGTPWRSDLARRRGFRGRRAVGLPRPIGLAGRFVAGARRRLDRIRCLRRRLAGRPAVGPEPAQHPLEPLVG